MEVGLQIGPTVEQVIGGRPVDDALLGHFHKRSGYARPAEVVDTGAIDEALREDLVGVGAS